MTLRETKTNLSSHLIFPLGKKIVSFTKLSEAILSSLFNEMEEREGGREGRRRGGRDRREIREGGRDRRERGREEGI